MVAARIMWYDCSNNMGAIGYFCGISRMIELLIVMNASNKCRIHEKKCGVYSRAAFIRVITVLDFGSLALA